MYLPTTLNLIIPPSATARLRLVEFAPFVLNPYASTKFAAETALPSLTPCIAPLSIVLSKDAAAPIGCTRQ
jgi:hypothetical protein